MKEITHFICLLTLAFSYSQTELIQILNNNSSFIIEGKVISSSSNFRPNGDIVTNYIVEKTQNLKGSAQANITVQVVGGQVDGHFQIVTHQVKLKTGDKGLFFLKRNSSSTNYFFKGEDYFMNYARLSKQEIDELNKSILNLYPDFEVISHSKNTTRAATNLAEITSVLPLEITAGTGSDLTISGTGFGAEKGTVGFLNGNDGGASYFFTYHLIKSWTDTEILVTVPQLAGTGRIKIKLPTTPETSIMAPFGTEITIPYARFTITTTNYGDTLTIPLRHIGEMPNGVNPPTSAHLTDGAYHFKMADSFYSNTNARSIFLDFLEDWSCKTGINFVNAGAKTLEDEFSGETLNEIRFLDFESLNYGGAASTSLRGIYTCPGSSSNPDPDTVTAIITQINFQYDSEINWGYNNVASNKFDFSFTTAHEIGHAVLFGHVIENSNLMHYAGGYGDRNLQEVQEPYVTAGVVGVNEALSPYQCGAPMTASSCFTLSLENRDIKNAISIRPIGSNIEIKTNSIAMIRQIYVYDISGRIVNKAQFKTLPSRYNINLDSNNTQIYMVKVRLSNDLVHVAKVLL
ncbi:MAG: IPT/TIG domain-containing protein [Flavobacteriaceae bacterium]